MQGRRASDGGGGAEGGFLVRVWRWLDRQVDVRLAEHREMIEQSWPDGDDVPRAPDRGHPGRGPAGEPPPSG